MAKKTKKVKKKPSMLSVKSEIPKLTHKHR
jgi:hypothetical protein